MLRFRVVAGGRLGDILWGHLEAIGATGQDVEHPEVVFEFRDTRLKGPGFEGPLPQRRYPQAHYVRCFVDGTRNDAVRDLQVGVVDEVLDLEDEPENIRRYLGRTLEV